MSLVAVQTFIRDTLQNLPMPNGGFNLKAYITPPDPNDEAEFPTAYIWPTEGTESRDPHHGGTIPRNTGPGTPSGNKPVLHTVDIYLVWFGSDEDPDADSWFPGMVDAVMSALRYSTMPRSITDPYTNYISDLVDLGENMAYEIVVSAVANQAYNRYDSRIRLRILELIFA